MVINSNPSLGALYVEQGKIAETKMYERALDKEVKPRPSIRQQSWRQWLLWEISTEKKVIEYSGQQLFDVTMASMSDI